MRAVDISSCMVECIVSSVDILGIHLSCNNNYNDCLLGIL